MAWLYGVCARVMLGPSSVELRERVEGLKDASARILAAADDERRRIERDLHDGAQQRLVALNVLLGVVETKLEKDPAAAAPLVARARVEATEAVKELRELARGIHPALLADRGLIAALEALAARAPFKVRISGVPDHRLPPAVEATAYFITAEALTNVAKYAGDEATATVELFEDRGRLRVTVRDDGAGGADPRRGTGLRGLNDRVAALDGRFEVTSPPGEGTTVVAELPLERPVRRALALLAALGAVALTGCDSGPPVSQTRDLGGFNRLEVSGDLSLDISLLNRPDPGVRITAGTKAIDRIKTEVVGDVLRVSTKSRGLTIGPDPLGDVSISLGVPALLALRVDESADVNLSGLSAKYFELRVDGSGDVKARGRVDDLEMEVDGSADDRPRGPRDAERQRPHRRLRRRRPARRPLAGADRRGLAATSPTSAARP